MNKFNLKTLAWIGLVLSIIYTCTLVYAKNHLNIPYDMNAIIVGIFAVTCIWEIKK